MLTLILPLVQGSRESTRARLHSRIIDSIGAARPFVRCGCGESGGVPNDPRLRGGSRCALPPRITRLPLAASGATEDGFFSNLLEKLPLILTPPSPLLARRSHIRHHLHPPARAGLDVRVVPLWLLAVVPVVLGFLLVRPGIDRGLLLDDHRRGCVVIRIPRPQPHWASPIVPRPHQPG
jgi:hypothetical protein